MRLTIINVGYGDALLFEADDGYTALLDGGSALPSEFEGDAYRIRAADYLKEKNIDRLDAVFVSHIHEDHVCGLEPILERILPARLFVPYPVEPFLAGRELTSASDAPRSVPLYAASLNAYQRILLKADRQGIPITVLHPGDSFRLAKGFAVHALAPGQGAIHDYMERLERAWQSDDAKEITGLLTELDRISNSTSLLLRFECAGAVILAAADNVPAHWDEVPKNLLKNVNVLKLPHHGQIDAVDERFMADMPLKYIITTASSDRRYNSANPEVYRSIMAMRRTDQAPRFLFSDEREYAPWFSHPDGFQAITLVIDSGAITTEFVKIINEKEKKQ